MIAAVALTSLAAEDRLAVGASFASYNTKLNATKLTLNGTDYELNSTTKSILAALMGISVQDLEDDLTAKLKETFVSVFLEDTFYFTDKLGGYASLEVMIPLSKEANGVKVVYGEDDNSRAEDISTNLNLGVVGKHEIDRELSILAKIGLDVDIRPYNYTFFVNGVGGYTEERRDLVFGAQFGAAAHYELGSNLAVEAGLNATIPFSWTRTIDHKALDHNRNVVEANSHKDVYKYSATGLYIQPYAGVSYIF